MAEDQNQQAIADDNGENGENGENGSIAIETGAVFGRTVVNLLTDDRSPGAGRTDRQCRRRSCGTYAVVPMSLRSGGGKEMP